MQHASQPAPCSGLPACLLLRLQIHNPCLIPADFKLFIEGKDSAFSVDPREAHLEPGAWAGRGEARGA